MQNDCDKCSFIEKQFKEDFEIHRGEAHGQDVTLI